MSTIMLNAYQIMLDSRNNLNDAFKNPEFTTGDTGKAKELMNNPTYNGDSDDAVVLEDALPVLKVFVPRMASGDSKVSESAKKVVNLFTYNVFADEDASWWNETLQKQSQAK